MNDSNQAPAPPHERRNPLSSRAHFDFKKGGRRRMLGAVVLTGVALVLLVVLGPDRDSVKKRFEYYGAPGELTIMPEIAIEDGSDEIRQLPKSLQAPPPPSRIEIEPEPEDDNAENPRPKDGPVIDSQPVDLPSLEPTPDADTFDRNQVELALPQQSNPDWYILHHVLPDYPFAAPEAEQRIPVIQVRAAIFVDAGGNVSEAMIQSANAGSAFTNEVLEAIRKWKFGWRVDPQAGRWIELTFNFNSPYGILPAG